MDANEEEIITKTSPSSSAFTPSFAGFILMIHSGHLRFAAIVVKKTSHNHLLHSRPFAFIRGKKIHIRGKKSPLSFFLEL